MSLTATPATSVISENPGFPDGDGLVIRMAQRSRDDVADAATVLFSIVTARLGRDEGKVDLPETAVFSDKVPKKLVGDDLLLVAEGLREPNLRKEGIEP